MYRAERGIQVEEGSKGCVLMLAAQRTQQAREHGCSHGRRVAHQVQHGVRAGGRQPREEGRLAVEASRGEQHLASSQTAPTHMSGQPEDGGLYS